jgi:uncharacterized protein YheU (UPF0270 family)
VRRCLPVAAFAVVLVSASPAVAEVTWQPLGALSAGVGPASQPQVAVDARGDAVYVWARWDGGTDCFGSPCERIQTRSRSAAGVLSPVQTLSPSGYHANFSQVAVDANGDAVFVWQRSGEVIQARVRSADGTLGPTLTVSAAGQEADYPQVAVAPNGNAVIAWQFYDESVSLERIQVRTLSAAGALGSTETLSPASQDAEYPQVAVDKQGDAVLAWDSTDGTTHRIQARVRSVAGTLTEIQTLAEGQYVSDVHLALDPGGDAIFAWLGFDGTVARTQTRARSAAGALSPIQTLSDPGKHAYFPRVGIDPGGDAVILWQRFDGIENRIQVRSRSAAGALGATQTLSGTGESIAVKAQLAVDPQGNAVVVWEHRDPTCDSCLNIQDVRALIRFADGTVGAIQTLSSAANMYAQEPQVAVGPNGHAFVVWDEQSDERTPDGRIYAAVGSY